MEEIQPLGAIDIHSGPQHLLGEALIDAQVRSGHGKVRQGDLHMQWHGDHVADHHIHESLPVGLETVVEHTVSEPVPEDYEATQLEVPVPGRNTPARSQSHDQVLQGQTVQVESAEKKDRVVEVMLIPHAELGESVVWQNTLVVGREYAAEESVGDGEEREMLDIRVMLGVIGDDMVDLIPAVSPTVNASESESACIHCDSSSTSPKRDLRGSWQ